MVLFQILSICAGVLLVAYTFLSATRTFVLPRSSSVALTGLVFKWVRKLFDLLNKAMPSFEQRDSLMALYAPLSLLMLVPTWLFITTIGYAFIFWGMGIQPWGEAYLLSGSSILTLGFSRPDALAPTVVAFTEATIGLILVAMLISYLPTMYSAFSKRETAVSLLEVRAGRPPTAPELIWRLHAMSEMENSKSFWEGWEIWFTEIEESHTSLAALVFFRSPRSGLSWVTAAGTVLDGAAFVQAVVDQPFSPYPTLVIRAGNMALRHIADFFRVQYNPDPHFPEDSISVSRSEFDAACDRLSAQGVLLKSDRDDAWQNFAGWRVNYDSVLNALMELTMAPPTPWLAEFTFVPVAPGSGKSGGELKRVSQ